MTLLLVEIFLLGFSVGALVILLTAHRSALKGWKVTLDGWSDSIALNHRLFLHLSKYKDKYGQLEGVEEPPKV